MLKFFKVIFVALIPFVIWALLIEFIFSFSNQYTFGTQLTLINFAAPFMLTVVFILIAGQRLIFKRDLIERLSLTKLLKLLIVVFVFFIVAWQVWYLLTLYQIRGQFEFTEFGPMLFGLGSTLFLAATIVRKKHGF